MHTVWPSGGAASVAWLAITPPPPGRLSTITGCFHSDERLSPSTRPRTSPVLPGFAPVMKRTGLDGKSPAAALPRKTDSRTGKIRMAAILMCAANERCVGDESDRGAGEHDRRHRHRAAVANPAHRGARRDAEGRLRGAKERGGGAGALAERRHCHRARVRGDEADAADHHEDRNEYAGETEEAARRAGKEQCGAGRKSVDAPAEHTAHSVARHHAAVHLRDRDEAGGAGAEIPAELRGRHAEVLDVDEGRGGQV